MNKDSRMRRSVWNLVLPITLKLSIDTGTPHDNACCLICCRMLSWTPHDNACCMICCRMLSGTPHDNACCLIFGWGGTVKRDPVRKLLPACSATLVCRVQIVEPTYSDAQCAQLSLYTREDRIANGSLSLKLKN